MRKAGLKVSPSQLLTVAKHLLAISERPVPNHRWFQSFQDRFNIVQRRQADKKQLSPQKELLIEKELAFHLGFYSKGSRLASSPNMDETHFIIYMDNGPTLSARGEQNIRYAAVVSGTTGMTMIGQVTERILAKIGVPMMIFSNIDCSYPIRGVPDSFAAARGKAREEKEERVEKNNPVARQLQWTWSNAGANATHLVQPADDFVISKIQDAWTKRWDEKKIQLVRDQDWQIKVRNDGSWSGALQNPEKPFFLQLAADSVRDVNAQRLKKRNITYA
uniref:Predicted protein putative n=1 Tax=Albugo laibachii Nc14 TaxID=890382 RepID=F0WXQ6_9STRA|nr:predicted protein putative [Albugo laibachii Nc14]|eukprot:CCA26252.1 predicted protein putative [Albugo laibachii Nc14]